MHHTLQLDEIPLDHILIQMFVCTIHEEKTTVTVQMRRLITVWSCFSNVNLYLLMCNLEF